MAETYTPPLAELPPWLSYSLVPILTTTRVFTVATLLPNGEPTLLPTSILQTIYTTEVIQLALTVDVGGGVPLGWPYTTAGGTGPTIASVLGGAAGREFTIGDITVLAGVTRTGALPCRDSVWKKTADLRYIASIGRTSVDETTRATSTSAAGASSSSRAQSLPPCAFSIFGRARLLISECSTLGINFFHFQSCSTRHYGSASSTIDDLSPFNFHHRTSTLHYLPHSACRRIVILSIFS